MGSIWALISQVSSLMEKIKEEMESHLKLLKLKEKILEGSANDPNYSYIRGLLLYKDRLVIQRTSDLVGEILKEFHDRPLGGHSGRERTYQRIKELFWWKGMYKVLDHNPRL